MQGTGYTRPVVIAEIADVGDDIMEVVVGNLLAVQEDLMIQETSFWWAAQIEHDFQ
jgi:hypothetical protein